MVARGNANELPGSGRNPLAPGKGLFMVAMLKACGLGTMVAGNTLGPKPPPPALRATEDIPVLLVIDTIIKMGYCCSGQIWR